jgi:hypothetical protein
VLDAATAYNNLELASQPTGPT